MLSRETSMRNIIMILPLLFVATIVFALPGHPPSHGGNCGPKTKLYRDSPDFPVPISIVFYMIREQKTKMFNAKIAPYIEIEPETGRELWRREYRPQIDAAFGEVEEWERRTKDKAEKYIEVDPCADMGLIIRAKYLDLIW